MIYEEQRVIENDKRHREDLYDFIPNTGEAPVETIGAEIDDDEVMGNVEETSS